MKTIKILKMREIVDSSIDLTDMGKLYAGTDSDVMLADYGCINVVCQTSRDTSIDECTVKKCLNVACTSGA